MSCNLFISFKVINGIILKDFSSVFLSLKIVNNSLRQKDRDIYNVPFSKSIKYNRALSVFLPKFCNKIVRKSLLFPFIDFKKYIFSNF